jgi:hypothetical protein
MTGIETPTVTEFDCEGCGVHVVALGLAEPPAHGFCCQCAFLCEYVPDPVEMWAVYQRLQGERHGG